MPPHDAARAAAQNARHARPVTFYDHLALWNWIRTNARMDAPLEGPKGYQFDEYFTILNEQRTKEIALYKATNNEIILKLDWNAPRMEFNRATLSGDWVHGAKLNNLARQPFPLPPAELVRNFVEVQIKRIDATDGATLVACGVHPDFAFLGLLEKPKENGDNATDKASDKASDEASDKAKSDSGNDTDTKSQTSPSSLSTVAGLMAASPGGWPSEPTKSSGDDKTKPASDAAKETTEEITKKTTEEATEETTDETTDETTTEAGPSEPSSSSTPTTQGTLPPRSAPLVVNGTTYPAPCAASPAPATAGPFPRSWAETSSSSSAGSDGTISEDEDPEAAFRTAEAIHRDTREAAQARLYHHLLTSREFPAVKGNAALYLVRIVGIPNPPRLATQRTSGATGPHKRFATLLGMGGWVVEDKEKLKCGEGKMGRMAALDVIKDWTFRVREEVEGEFLPVWKGEREPGLEDVYNMVWDLVMRRKFVGVTQGYGFGVRNEGEGFPLREMMEENPFETQN